MKAALFLCAHCMFATRGVNSPSGCEVPLIQSQAEGWATDPQSGLAVHVQAPRDHWRFGRHLQEDLYHSGTAGSGLLQCFLASPFPGANKKATSSSS